MNKHITVWRNFAGTINDSDSACEFLLKARAMPGYEVDYISLRDLVNRNDEGNASVQLSGDTDSSELYDAMQSPDIDYVSLVGNYRGKLLVIGVDLRSKTTSASMKNADADLFKEVRRALK